MNLRARESSSPVKRALSSTENSSNPVRSRTGVIDFDLKVQRFELVIACRSRADHRLCNCDSDRQAQVLDKDGSVYAEHRFLRSLCKVICHEIARLYAVPYSSWVQKVGSIRFVARTLEHKVKNR